MTPHTRHRLVSEVRHGGVQCDKHENAVAWEGARDAEHRLSRDVQSEVGPRSAVTRFPSPEKTQCAPATFDVCRNA
jgi:hypothetical protein